MLTKILHLLKSFAPKTNSTSPKSADWQEVYVSPCEFQDLAWIKPNTATQLDDELFFDFKMTRFRGGKACSHTIGKYWANTKLYTCRILKSVTYDDLGNALEIIDEGPVQAIEAGGMVELAISYFQRCE